MFDFAAEYGSLDLMKWLRNNGCPFDDYTFNNAAKNGNIENMKICKG